MTLNLCLPGFAEGPCVSAGTHLRCLGKRLITLLTFLFLLFNPSRSAQGEKLAFFSRLISMALNMHVVFQISRPMLALVNPLRASHSPNLAHLLAPLASPGITVSGGCEAK